MKVFFGEKWRMGPQETLNLLMSPISELRLHKKLEGRLVVHRVKYVGDLLFKPESEVILQFGLGSFLELRDRIEKFSCYDIELGMFAHLPSFVRELFNQAKGYRTIIVPSEKVSLGRGNAHPGFPRSEANYHGDFFNSGEW